jgi:hypothetical protein
MQMVLAVCPGDIPLWIFIPAMAILALIVLGMALQQQDDELELDRLRSENERLKHSH